MSTDSQNSGHCRAETFIDFPPICAFCYRTGHCRLNSKDNRISQKAILFIP